MEDQKLGNKEKEKVCNKTGRYTGGQSIIAIFGVELDVLSKEMDTSWGENHNIQNFMGDGNVLTRIYHHLGVENNYEMI